jgi:hypothetical protein
MGYSHTRSALAIASGLKSAGIKVVFDLHFVIQKENSSIDRMFTKMALRKAVNYFVTHARKTYDVKVAIPHYEVAFL